MSGNSVSSDNTSEYLFACLAEQLKIPMTQVAHIAENLIAKSEEYDESVQSILDISQSTQKLINGFLLSQQLSKESKLDLEPVSVGSVLYDTVDSLQAYASLHNCRLELYVSGKNGPIMARADLLKSAVENLTISLINMSTEDSKQTIKLAVRRTGRVISTGVFSHQPTLSNGLLDHARNLYGRAHQPLSRLTSDNAAGVFLADNLISSMGSSMKVSRLGKLSGFSASFKPSHQLSLV